MSEGSADDATRIAEEFRSLIEQAERGFAERRQRGAVGLDFKRCVERAQFRLTQQHIDYLRRSYSEGALTFGSEEHDTWVVDITEAAPFLLHMAEELLRRPP